MSKIAVLLPKEYMLEQARKVIQEKNADIDILKVIKTSDSVYEARKAMEQGAGIIVARGVQAAYCLLYTSGKAGLCSQRNRNKDGSTFRRKNRWYDRRRMYGKPHPESVSSYAERGKSPKPSCA